MFDRDPDKTELARKIENTVAIGTVSQVDHKLNRYRVKIGELETDWIPSAVSRSGGTRTFESRDVGEQVVMAAPSGDLSQGVILGAIATEARQAGEKGSEHRTIYPDGTTVDYDDEAGGYRIALAENRSAVTTVGDVSFTTSKDGVSISVGGFSFKITSGGLAMKGGKITHDDLNIGSDHVHGGIEVGLADTQGPH